MRIMCRRTGTHEEQSHLWASAGSLLRSFREDDNDKDSKYGNRTLEIASIKIEDKFFSGIASFKFYSSLTWRGS